METRLKLKPTLLKTIISDIFYYMRHFGCVLGTGWTPTCTVCMNLTFPQHCWLTVSDKSFHPWQSLRRFLMEKWLLRHFSVSVSVFDVPYASQLWQPPLCYLWLRSTRDNRGNFLPVILGGIDYRCSYFWQAAFFFWIVFGTQVIPLNAPQLLLPLNVLCFCVRGRK